MSVFCKGCGVAFKGQQESPVHLNGSCWSRWEYGCLISVQEAADELLEALGSPGSRSIDSFKDQLRESLDALEECRSHHDE